MTPEQAAAAEDAPATVTRLIADNFLDAELAALLWLLLGGDMPFVVSGRGGSGRQQLIAALEPLLPSREKADGGDQRGPMVLEEDSLEAVFERLERPPTSLQPDQLRALGIVLVLRDVEDLGRRLVAAHYLRPVERDAAGHLQRRPPALLAAHDRASDRLEHFAWAITAELADRIGMSVGQFEKELGRRTRLLADLAAAAVFEPDRLGLAIGEFRAAERH